MVSVAGLALVPKTFTPDADFASSALRIELPPGVLLSQTAAASAQAYQILKRYPEVANVVESLGESEDGEVRSGNLYIQLVPPSQRKLTQKQWEAQAIKELRRIPDARVTFQSQSDGEGRDLTLYVVGSNPQMVDQTAREAVEQMRGLKELRDPRINGDMARPELEVRPKLDKAAQLGVTVASISETVRLATLGDLPQNEAKFSLPDRQIPIRVSLIESARSNLATIENLPVRTSGGTTVPLKAVADIGFGQGPSKVRRYNQNRRVSLEADLNNAQLGTALDKIRALPVYKHLPAGVQDRRDRHRAIHGGAVRELRTGDGSGVMLVFAVLVLLFVRVFQPITILSALPLSIGGAVLALVAHAQPILAVDGAGHFDVDGDRREEFHFAGGLRDRGNAQRQGPPHGVARSGAQARAAYRHDVGGDDRGHAAGGDGGERLVPGADGDCGDRRVGDLDRTDAGHGAGDIHMDR